MARNLSMNEAVNEALDQEMARDPAVVIMGEDISGGTGAPGEDDAWGGPLGVTKGLSVKYGDRVMDTPLSESAFIGAAIGAACSGLRPVAELMFVDFMGVCFDEIFNQAAKFRYMFGGKAETPVVIRCMAGAGFRAAAQHSQMLTPIFTHIPGLKVVFPSNAYDGTTTPSSSSSTRTSTTRRPTFPRGSTRSPSRRRTWSARAGMPPS